jgi:GT2 family glycosyltransferase
LKILVGSVTRQVPEVLKAHLETLKAQRGDFTIDFAFVDDNENEESSTYLNLTGKVFQAGPKQEGAEYSVSETTHHWTLPLFHWLGREKQRLIDYAKAERYDALWLVDSDLLCSPDTLSSLLDTQKEVVSSVFWTKWSPQSPPLPQVWLAHPYEFQGMGREAHEFLGDIANRKLVRVAGLGACTLIRSSVFDKVAYWPLLEGLPNHSMWQGEDRHFCVRAQRNHVELWADAWPDVWHCYRPSDRERIPEMLAALRESGDDQALISNLVSFTVQPLEEPNMGGYVEHVRGRLGCLKVLPEIENALQEMRVGDDRIIKVRFPMFYDIPEYRGVVKLLRIKLLGAKPFSYAPTLSETVIRERGIAAITEPFMEAA